MDDKKIRKILVSYLTATNSKIRIYQEKNIGASICDVMAVTDKLVGYEIKSDLDNYSRLPEQIRAYNMFFDMIYIVVGESHLKSVEQRVPEFWGVVKVKNDEIDIIREAKPNKKVQRRKQLSVLWKLELKNLLIKNDMPLFAQKEKGFIADRIADQVDDLILGKQIADELMNRDYSIYDAKDYTIYSEDKDPFPAEEIVDALSEKDFKEFTLDKWIALYKQAMTVKEQKEIVLERINPLRTSHEITYKEIEVSLGVPWVSAEIINDFVEYLLDEKPGYRRQIVKYEEITGTWFIDEKRCLGDRNTNATVKYGLMRYNALFIVEASLNLREIKLYDYGTKYNHKDTIAALEKQKLIDAEFKSWIWQDEDRIWQVEEAYNKLFSGYKSQEYDGSRLVFPEMNSKYELFPYQKNAVQKIVKSKNTLLAFDVGAGKTYIMIAAAMKMRIDGISRKNMFVVPNHIVGQWEKIFTELYPKAKVLAIEPKTFKPEMRQKVLEQVKNGDYDGIIIAYSCFEMIPLSADSIIDNMNKQLTRINETINHYKTEYNGVNYYHWEVVPLEKERKYILNLTNDFVESVCKQENDEKITFEKLEINTIFLDEAHNYKNLPIRTKLKDMTGISTKGSQKCLDMMHKIRCVQNNNGGRGAVLATGTPLCNSISDTYVMQMYLQSEKMEKSHLDVFDNWVKTFAKPEVLFEIDVNATSFRRIKKFVRFFNLPELSRMFSEIAVFYANTNIEGLPHMEGYSDVVIPRHKELKKYMEDLCDRTENIRMGMIDRSYDNMLKVSNDGRKAALDLKLVGKEQPEGKYSKIDCCVKNVVSISEKYPHTTQIIFCDYSTPKGDDYSVYKELKEKLVRNGIASNEIVFIHNYETESKKVALYNKFNDGKVKVLIGSTFKLGTGANVQNKLKALHHLDVPWRPADMVQREGRIVRKGNQNETVLVYRYVTKGSFDSYSWQILETKQKFISQFLSGSTYQRTAADLEDNVLSYSEVKALALAEPLMKKITEKENEIKTLEIIISKESEANLKLIQEKKQLESDICDLHIRRTSTIENAEYLKRFNDKAFAEAYNYLAQMFTDIFFADSNMSETISVLDFNIVFPGIQNKKKIYLYVERLDEKYAIEIGSSATGNARRIINFLKKFDKLIVETEKALRNAKKRKEDLEMVLSEGNDEYMSQLISLKKEVEELRGQTDICVG